MGNTPSLPENEENDGSDDETAGNNTDAVQSEDLTTITRPTVTNVARRGDPTIDEVAHLVQRHSLPEAVISDVQNFQRVSSSTFFEL